MDDAIAIIEIGLSFPERFYFGACQHDTSDVFIINIIFEECLSVFNLDHG
jgi:hypothetical protein